MDILERERWRRRTRRLGRSWLTFLQSADQWQRVQAPRLRNLQQPTNTLGNQKPFRRWTWHSPDGPHHNQTDYILVKKRFRSGIKTAIFRKFPGADVGSDHDMVTMTFQTRLKNTRKPTQPRIRFDPEKHPTVIIAFHATIGVGFTPLPMLVDEDADLDSMVTHFNKATTQQLNFLASNAGRGSPW